MHAAYILAVLSLVSAARAGTAPEKSLAALSRDLKEKGVETTSSAGSPTFAMAGCVAPEWDQSWSAKVGQFYASQKTYQGVIVTCLACMTSGEDTDPWASAAKRCSGVVQTLRRQGVPEKEIEVHVHVRSGAAKEGFLQMTLRRERAYLHRAGHNLVSGVKDVVLSPTELPVRAYRRGKQDGVVAGGTVGVVGGVGSALRRAGHGAVRLLTFWAG